LGNYWVSVGQDPALTELLPLADAPTAFRLAPSDVGRRCIWLMRAVGVKVKTGFRVASIL